MLDREEAYEVDEKWIDKTNSWDLDGYPYTQLLVAAEQYQKYFLYVIRIQS